MNTIHKFPLLDPKTVVWVPSGAKVVEVHQQHGYPCLWIALNTAVENVERRFVWVGTGFPIEDGLCYIGTVHCGDFVWHVLEDLRPKVLSAASG